jgi:hypothetical protein
MPAESGKRAPLLDDVLMVLSELEKHRVRYALLGGVAMAVHGFPRMTKDIDCLFPRDPDNNARLMAAIDDIAKKVRMDHLPQKEWLDRGYSTAAEGEIGIDILFVAASKEFDDYEKHIEVRDIDGVRVSVLDIDGMLMSKETDRPEDIPDRMRLARLKA